MRAGICSVQLQTLTPGAVSLVKQAFNLARRRGHAQVTPLHVASTMLASSTGLLRRACLQAHSHPLQCKALELCFNVALNRLPASTSSALLGPQSSYPSLSNALVAAFKRAQAHQRRGSVENQQQPILALKIEIEQLIISILDDPSVSRVMREAGFSSTQVKNKVEQAVSLEICPHQSSVTVSSQSRECTKPHVLTASEPQSLPLSQFGIIHGKPLDQVGNDDVMSVLNALVRKKRNTVITGECLATAESVVRGVMEKVERGEASGDLRSARFISLPLFSLRSLSKEKLEQKLVELRCTVKSYMSNGVVLYLGDLKWISDFWSSYGEQRRRYYCTVDHIITELKNLVHGFSETGRLWLMGIATFQTYMKCKAGHPSLESMWELYPVTIPIGSLSLSLKLDSDSQSHQSRSKVSMNGSSWPLLECGVDNHSACWTDYSDKFNRESQSLARRTQNKESTTGISISTSSSLPLWLQKCKEETDRNTTNDKTEYLSNKGSLLFGSVHKQSYYPEKTIKFASSPPSPNSVSSHELNTDSQQTHLSWPVIFEKENHIWISECSNEVYESSLRNGPKPDLLSNPNSSPNSASSSEAMDYMEGVQSFKDFNDYNLKNLRSGLEKKVPWQKDIIPEIATTILECRSGMRKRKAKLNHIEDKAETWLFFLGVDVQGKEKIARELAKLVFGSQSNFVSIGLNNFSSSRADSTEESKNKRARDELGCNYLERLGLALNENPHRVFFMEDVDRVDKCSQKGIKQAIENGSLTLPDGEKVPFKDAIIVFSCESFSSVSRACSGDHGDKEDEGGMDDRSPVLSLDLNISFEDDNGDEYSLAENGILESVDRQVIFKIQELMR
ncbi:DOUBLE CLP-N MOTIF P-LOOP NUCLEOSIDE TRIPHOSPHATE HYDROLASE SUPERFAMILY PROTEIN [Salix koriyanagi]|uniref:DOUBLE CLP-N MOTIF P-LOOP NUCLEOSIDE TRIPHOSPHATE HYDROLASE SUPERFAMILY PROTEIN n=1 Tax=Salix koriyanagi TaxID=2511006 RepID=A0A9Q0WIX6_9ROSI|nr:DOUBLE CLP-N MOTIF P-LOOP NUCLEOSIDE TRIPHOSPHATE HYDROLASE SUPERFAMILY PROTEIN [Salix koriyanagi]